MLSEVQYVASSHSFKSVPHKLRFVTYHEMASSGLSCFSYIISKHCMSTSCPIEKTVYRKVHSTKNRLKIKT